MQQILQADWLVASPESVHAEGGIVVRAGRVSAVLASAAEVRRARALAEPVHFARHSGALAPGFVDAHAHLELSGLQGQLPAGPDFAAWVRRLLALRAELSRKDFVAAAERGARDLRASGTTLVGDIDSSGALGSLTSGNAGSGLRFVRYVELLDGQDETRSAAALARWRAVQKKAGEDTPRAVLGVAPHAPFSVSPALLAAIGRALARRQRPVAIHWAETQAEVEYLAHGSGPLAALLGPSPRKPPLAQLAAAGLVGARTALVHGNHPEPGDWDQIARAGATLVHCPGSHRFFGREPFALQAAREHGVRIALGTDSLASNAELDMRRELALLAAEHAELEPADLLRMATVEGARALGFAGRSGVLLPGAHADAVLHGVNATDAADVLAEIARGQSQILASWIGEEHGAFSGPFRALR